MQEGGGKWGRRRCSHPQARFPPVTIKIKKLRGRTPKVSKGRSQTSSVFMPFGRLRRSEISSQQYKIAVFSTVSVDFSINLVIATLPEGFPIALWTPSAFASAEAIPPATKKTSTGKNLLLPMLVGRANGRDNVEVVDRASWRRSCGSAKLLAGTLRCLRLCWRLPLS